MAKRDFLVSAVQNMMRFRAWAIMRLCGREKGGRQGEREEKGGKGREKGKVGISQITSRVGIPLLL